MRVDVVTGLPKLLDGPLSESILKRAQERGVVTIVLHDLRDYATDKHQTIDDTPYGGGAGMVLKPEPIFSCLERLMSERKYDEIIYLTPDGDRMNQALVTSLSLKQNLILLCGHYKGIDERVREELVTQEVSIGDYVLTGGELAAAVVIDAMVRLIPGAMNDSQSAMSDSFQDGLLGSPQYTRPAEFRGKRVPEVLLSGNHEEIERWRTEQRMERTRLRRKDLLDANEQSWHH